MTQTVPADGPTGHSQMGQALYHISQTETSWLFCDTVLCVCLSEQVPVQGSFWDELPHERHPNRWNEQAAWDSSALPLHLSLRTCPSWFRHLTSRVTSKLAREKKLKGCALGQGKGSLWVHRGQREVSTMRNSSGGLEAKHPSV